MLAERLNIDNPSQWLTNREHKPMEHKLVNTKDNSTEAKNDLLTVAKEMHDRWIQLFDGKNDCLLMKTAKEELVGYSKNNNLFFHTSTMIKAK